MASLDVESLFTNIPVDETIKIAVDDLFSSNMYRGKLSKSELYYLPKLATSETSFFFLITFCINKLMAFPWAHL